MVCILILLNLSYVPTARGAQDVKPTDPIVVDRTDFPSLYLSVPNMQGEAVWLLQARLREMGYDIVPSGIYDAITSSTVRMFQVAHGLVDDGIVNQDEWMTLMPDDPDASVMQKNTALKGRALIVIDVATRKLVLYEDGTEVCRFPVAVGKSETPTPLGEWRVVQKSYDWGNGFGTRWMGLNVPWGIFGIHGTNKPYSIGTYASHGCIRMFNRDVEKLFPLVPQGCRVKIVSNGRMMPKQMRATKLKLGSNGQSVVYLQARLQEVGIRMDRADGRYGHLTELAVKYYQVWHGLEVTGMVDEATYRSLGMIK